MLLGCEWIQSYVAQHSTGLQRSRTVHVSVAVRQRVPRVIHLQVFTIVKPISGWFTGESVKFRLFYNSFMLGTFSRKYWSVCNWNCVVIRYYYQSSTKIVLLLNRYTALLFRNHSLRFLNIRYLRRIFKLRLITLMLLQYYIFLSFTYKTLTSAIRFCLVFQNRLQYADRPAYLFSLLSITPHRRSTRTSFLTLKWPRSRRLHGRMVRRTDRAYCV